MSCMPVWCTGMTYELYVWMYGPGGGGGTMRLRCMAVCEDSYSVPHTTTHTSISGTARLTGGMNDMKVKAMA